MIYNSPTPDEIGAAIRVLVYFETALIASGTGVDPNVRDHMTRAAEDLRAIERRGIMGAAYHHKG